MLPSTILSTFCPVLPALMIARIRAVTTSHIWEVTLGHLLSPHDKVRGRTLLAHTTMFQKVISSLWSSPQEPVSEVKYDPTNPKMNPLNPEGLKSYALFLALHLPLTSLVYHTGAAHALKLSQLGMIAFSNTGLTQTKTAKNSYRTI
ncbi:hypothetical protein HHX47_DHR9000496 [Lentinula edodes]|nr:hypothetical protein HHX47_DHR9000496 [Lentinula edodes]